MIDSRRLRNAYDIARRDLLADRQSQGHWVGELSASALSTATAVSALALVARHAPGGGSQFRPHWPQIARGLDWLARHQNEDGAWGDTDKSFSNIATTMLVCAAFHLAGQPQSHAQRLEAAGAYIRSQGGLCGLQRRYGKDKTFAVPILTNCALAGLEPWSNVPPLPFELACLPYRLLRFLRLAVVSYAVPALVAVGQARYFHRKPRNPITRLVRRMSVRKSLSVLERMQPASGGFLEAIPLTSFVIMSLAATGRADHAVVRRGTEFLLASVRSDGSWPIDTDLSTWNTTLAVNALSAAGEDVRQLGCLEWLLACQHRQLHPFTHAAPGGWSWSDRSGAVPDADDTSGALLALAALGRSGAEDYQGPVRSAVAAGIRWLLNLQNSDGGWPTFCRGWGAMPFDRSGVDLTAHAVRALYAWRQRAGCFSQTVSAAQLEAAIRRGCEHLARWQRTDGSWVPLWFGNQYDRHEENPIYGTARVLLAYRDLGLMHLQPARRGLQWLVTSRGPDGGWGSRTDPGCQGAAGAGSSVEETALAVEALLGGMQDPSVQTAVSQGLGWLVEAVGSGRHRETAPIGFYFARLWYYERLYPLVFTVSALGRALGQVYPTTKAASAPAASHHDDTAR